MTAVLQPLTLSSGTLTLVRSNVTVLVEKLLKFSNSCRDVSKETENFIQKSVETLLPRNRKWMQERGNDDFST